MCPDMLLISFNHFYTDENMANTVLDRLLFHFASTETVWDQHNDKQWQLYIGTVTPTYLHPFNNKVN